MCIRDSYYVVFDRYQNLFRLFQLVGIHYQELTINNQRFWFEELKLGLGVWWGTYQDTDGLGLRWFDAAGNWTDTAAERSDRLAAKLRELGIDPDEVK
ncbi:hypothetical protein C7271_20465 [filamentous cyanobacterium CCP5]|nr:hypothetical protein C7271_20465 [filamentous cyanobacterium CCP5]